MFKRLVPTLILYTLSLSAFEKLPQEYTVCFGSKEAPVEIIQYFSLTCPHCVSLFRTDFPEIKKDFIDAAKIKYTFHPVPMDLPTLQLMICLEKLPNSEKQILLKVMLEELDLEHPEITPILLKYAMQLLKKPVLDLESDEAIKEASAFDAATKFVLQQDIPKSIPSLQIENSIVCQSPEYSFIASLITQIIDEVSYEY